MDFVEFSLDLEKQLTSLRHLAAFKRERDCCLSRMYFRAITNRFRRGNICSVHNFKSILFQEIIVIDLTQLKKYNSNILFPLCY